MDPRMTRRMTQINFNARRSQRHRPFGAPNTASATKRIVRCQAWKIPVPKPAVRTFHNKGKVRRSYSHDYTDFEYFCPACNVTFRCFEEYQCHIIIKEQQRPYQEEIRETVRFMKEVIEQIPHKEPGSADSTPMNTPNDTVRPRSTLVQRPRSTRIKGRLRNMHNLVNFTMQLELLQNKIDYDHEQKNYSQKGFKFNLSKSAKKYFALDQAVEQVKLTKQRLVDIRKKREFRECQRVAKCVPSMIGRMGDGMGDSGRFSNMQHSRLTLRNSRKWKGLTDATHRMSELKEALKT